MLENKGSIFDDLPEEGGAPIEEKKEEAPDKRESETEIRKLTGANAEAEKKAQKLRDELAAKRAEQKKLKEELKKADEPEEEEDAEEEKPKETNVQKAVQEALREREEVERKQRLAQKIKAIAKTRQEAEEMYAEALKLPPSGDDDLDVEFASQRVQGLKEKRRGFISPSFSGGSGTDFESRQPSDLEGFDERRLKVLEQMGVSKDEVKKYKDGPDFGRLFPKTIVNNK